MFVATEWEEGKREEGMKKQSHGHFAFEYMYLNPIEDCFHH
jgi:hypothetical protein